ncbi:MAG: hypothetical protein AAF806_15245 [Bacteroidota bacterium]
MTNKLTILSLILFLSAALNAQNGKLFGVADVNLIFIDETTAATEIVATISESGLVRDLAYSTKDHQFYGIVQDEDDFRLVSFGTDGVSSTIGILNLPGETIFLCESLAFNQKDEELYASVSLNGGTANNDFFSESIIRIDVSTAVAEFVTTVSFQNSSADDIDQMVFVGDELYIHDGIQPIVSNFYSLDFSDTPASTSFASFLFEDQYYSMGDLAYNGDKLYFPTQGFGLYEWDPTTSTINFIGQTHDGSQYNGQRVRGLDFMTESKPNADKGAPLAFTYQGVATSNNGRVIRNRAITLEASIVKDKVDGEIVYTETHDLETDNFGFFSTAIGLGQATLGDFADIDWSTGCYFLQLSIDTGGGDDFVLLGITQLLSVPYALYAETSGKTKTIEKSIFKSPDGNCWEMSVSNEGEAVFTPVDCGNDN